MNANGCSRVGLGFALSLMVSCGSAIAGEYAVGLKGGALLEGAQNTLKSGAGGGVLFELRSSERWQFEADFTYGRDNGGGPYSDPQVTVVQLDVRARRTFGSGRVRPFAEAGLGVYDLKYESTTPVVIAPGVSWGETSSTAMGGPLGAGATIGLSRLSDLRVGVEYHWIAAEISAGGLGGLSGSSGNLEDYVWIGAAFTYRLASGK